MIVVASDIVAPPLWKWDRRTSGTKDGKGEDKQAGKTGTVKCTGDEVGVVLENAWSIVTKVKLSV